MESTRQGQPASQIILAPLAESDVESADRIMRLAFGTFIGLPDPQSFLGDAECIRTRWRVAPSSVFGATMDGKLVGSNVATHWGSVGFFGPLSVDPQVWDRGLGSRLMEPILACFDTWGTTFAGLCTFPQSAKHIGLYQKFGFWPRFLTANMSRPVSAAGERPNHSEAAPRWSRYSELPEDRRADALAACRELTGSVYDGLDVQVEIDAIHSQRLGDTVLLWDVEDETRLVGLATCHCGAGSEAASGACYLKFGVARPGPHANETFTALLDACDAYAAVQNLSLLTAGVNTARYEAYRSMLAYGFRTQMHSIIMQRNNEIGYNRPGAYLIDDWR